MLDQCSRPVKESGCSFRYDLSMLKSIRVLNLAVIQEAVVEFGPGLNLLTGETGAGKSILVDALGLVGGDRADTGLVRSGSDRGLVEAVFDLPPDDPAVETLLDRGLAAAPAGNGDVELIIRREIKATGSGRVFINDSPCTLSTLRDVAGMLLDMHRQHDQQSLLSREYHLRTLDRFGGHRSILDRTAEAFREVTAAVERLAELRELAGHRRTRMEELETQIREIEDAAPLPGESNDVAARRRILKNRDLLHEQLLRLEPLLDDGEGSAAGCISAAASRVGLLAELDDGLAPLLEQLERARIEVQDVASSLQDYRGAALPDSGESPGAALEKLETRAALLDQLLLRYGADETEVLAYRDRASAELATLNDLDGEVRKVEEERQAAADRYLKRAVELTSARKRAARRLTPAFRSGLRELAMSHAAVEVRFQAAAGEMVRSSEGKEQVLSPRGGERAEFLLGANPGEPAVPLAKAASGGELSRVMLALHGVLGKTGAAGRILVFDEIDTGIGGEAADRLGARLKELSRSHQVLCVTHLPQVAAYADSHHSVAKAVAGGRTRVQVVALDDERRIGELARMLGGKRITEATRKNAAEMIQAAGREA